MADITDELEVSRSTVKRDLAYMRNRMNAPIIWDAYWHGYRYQDPPEGQPRFSLPGLWFERNELYSLLIMEHLIKRIQPDFLAEHLDPLRIRVQKLLRGGKHSVEELARRVRIVSGSNPPIDSEIYHTVAEALLGRRQVHLCHINRSTNVAVRRHVSPQRLVYYNENWYLDGWCHLRDDLRTFRLSYMTEADVTDLSAVDVAEDKLDSELQAGFGIFVGANTTQAVLRFSTQLSAWIHREHWHSDQSMRMDETDRLILTLPFSNDPELIMRILSYGADVEVLQPANLRSKISAKLKQASALYED